MIGFTLVIPFLTYFIQDLAEKAGTVDVGNRDWWVGITLAKLIRSANSYLLL